MLSKFELKMNDDVKIILKYTIHNIKWRKNLVSLQDL